MMHYTTLQTHEQSQTGHQEMKTVLNEKQATEHSCKTIPLHEFIKQSNCSLNKNREERSFTGL